jgi:hypothetical protein
METDAISQEKRKTDLILFINSKLEVFLKTFKGSIKSFLKQDQTKALLFAIYHIFKMLM